MLLYEILVGTGRQIGNKSMMDSRQRVSDVLCVFNFTFQPLPLFYFYYDSVFFKTFFFLYEEVQSLKLETSTGTLFKIWRKYNLTFHVKSWESNCGPSENSGDKAPTLVSNRTPDDAFCDLRYRY